MSYLGAKIVIVCGFLTHIVFTTADYALFQGISVYFLMAISATQGVTFLFYPLLGFLADTCCTRYNFVKSSTVLQLVGALLEASLVVLILGFKYNSGHSWHTRWYVIAVVAVLVVIEMVAFGMFEANSIQFVMDQMIEATSDQLSGLVHWYFWSISLGSLVVLLVTCLSSLTVITCLLPLGGVLTSLSWIVTLFSSLTLPLCVLKIVMLTVSLCLLHYGKKHLAVEPARHNPFPTLYKVLKYSWLHKCPENRSAFTYWENDIPPRIDLGKSKYGGPFTTEEVEDVKTFFGIFILLVSLFGVHITGNNFSLSRHLLYKSCPSALLLAAVTVAPQLFGCLIMVITIPVIHFILRPYISRYIPNLLHRLGVGLAVVFFQEVAGIVIGLYSLYKTSPCIVNMWYPFTNCYIQTYSFNINGSCGTLVGRESSCSSDNSIFWWILVVVFFRVLSHQIVTVSAFEFICAQAPLPIKGTLFGFWYSLSALHYVIANPLDIFIQDDVWWLSIRGVKCCFILLSVLAYCCVAKHYRYRIRDDVVNERYLVEEVYDRELQQAEEYRRERKEETRALYGYRVRHKAYSAISSLQY